MYRVSVLFRAVGHYINQSVEGLPMGLWVNTPIGCKANPYLASTLSRALPSPFHLPFPHRCGPAVGGHYCRLLGVLSRFSDGIRPSPSGNPSRASSATPRPAPLSPQRGLAAGVPAAVAARAGGCRRGVGGSGGVGGGGAVGLILVTSRRHRLHSDGSPYRPARLGSQSGAERSRAARINSTAPSALSPALLTTARSREIPFRHKAAH